MGAQADAAKAPRKQRAKTKRGAKEKPSRRASDREVEALKNEMLGITIAVGCLAIFLALISFFPEDVSKMGEAATTGRSHNLIGPVGAHIANMILAVLDSLDFYYRLRWCCQDSVYSPDIACIRVTGAIAFPALIVCCGGVPPGLDQRTVLSHFWRLDGAHGAEIIAHFWHNGCLSIRICHSLALTFVMSTGVSLVTGLREQSLTLGG